MYNMPDGGNMDTYVMQGTELNLHLQSPVFENAEIITSDGASEYVVDPGLYYPASSYSYYCTGLESPCEWDDHHAVLFQDGADVQYVGAQTENLPYVCYTPGYGYGESPFNPYNPYIPGAMVGIDGPYVAVQPYYTVSPYQNPISSPGYFPVVAPSGPDIVASSSSGTLSDVGPSAAHRVNDSSMKRSHSASPASIPVHSLKATSSQVQLPAGASQKVIGGTTIHPLGNQASGSTGSLHGASSHIPQSGTGPITLPSTGNISHEELGPQANHAKFSFPVGGGLSNYGTNGQVVLNNPWSKSYYYRSSNNENGNPDQLGEQNRGPRINKLKNQFVVKAYTSKTRECNQEGNIVLSADQYNKDDFPVDHVSAKFFVIKSYSEDDVHKSIKYNVWSSTPNGNNKLNCAFEDAQKIAVGKPRGCPVFLFFSVNASGQFCGVAEMVGPVDFERDMDFWQQDKWSGSFPVKWHIIKDVPNPSFRHIILENNEHKPVTNSRDTQEIMLRQGLEMLNIFKNYTSKTSLLDDFMYYENRQRIMLEERARLDRKSNVRVHVHAPEPPVNLISVVDRPQKVAEIGTWIEKGAQASNPSGLEKVIESIADKVSSNANVENLDVKGERQKSVEQPSDAVATLKIGSLSIHPKQLEHNLTATTSLVNSSMEKTAAATANVVTVGSMPIKVDGINRSSKMLTVGTIPLDPKALQHGKVGGFARGGSQK